MERRADAHAHLDEAGERLGIDKMYDGRTTALDREAGLGIAFFPTSFGRPRLPAPHATGRRPVIPYPVATANLPHPATGELPAGRLEALAHPTRLRMCRSLAFAPHTTGELATSPGMSAPEVSRHPAVLRKADLLTTRRQGGTRSTVGTWGWWSGWGVSSWRRCCVERGAPGRVTSI